MRRFRLIEERTMQAGLSIADAEKDRVDYTACIRQVLRQPLAGMSWLEDAEKSIRVINALEGKKLGDLLELEDADHEHLCKHVRDASWAIFDERLLRFSHAVLDATEWPLDTSPEERGDDAASNQSNGYAPTDIGATHPVSVAPRMGRKPRRV